MSVMPKGAGAALMMCATLFAADAAAFCGTFVSGAGEEMFNSATQVVLMRSGTQTILSMENDYQGPTENFAMVVPVPVVLQQEDVKTLDPDIFRRIDILGAPRLVEYAEKDPCQDRYYTTYDYVGGCPWNNNGQNDNTSNNSTGGGGGYDQPMRDESLYVEAEFSVGEYDVVILSANDAASLTSWLDTNGYTLGAGAADVLNAYVQQGMYFFVAKIDATKVTFDANGKALLSPLRFSYPSPDLSLPIRLGLLNSAGEQDLIVNILSTEGRYEVSNYPNAYVPTNQLVSQSTRESFGAFYNKLFSQTVAQNPGAVVTEYAWSWGGFLSDVKCDPCPTPPAADIENLSEDDLSALGNDVVSQRFINQNDSWFGWTLTRLHARYGKEGVEDDLVFALAGDLKGGNGTSGRNQAETSSEAERVEGQQESRFQGRYIMHNIWPEEVTCEDAVRGRWRSTDELGTAPGPTSVPSTDIPGMSVDDFILTPADIPATGQPTEIRETIDLGPCTEPTPEWWNGEEPDRSGGAEGGAGDDAENTAGCATTGVGAPAGIALTFMLSGLITFIRRRRREL